MLPLPPPPLFLQKRRKSLILLLLVNYQCFGNTGLTNAAQTSLRVERDKLLTEKESWNKPSGSAPTAAESGPTPSEWEAEKTRLTKARDEALEKVTV